MFSPDGRWIAYVRSDSSVFVRPFRGSGGPWRVGCCAYPRWSTTKRELLFLDATFHLRGAAYTVVGDSFRADASQVWTPMSIAGGLAGGGDRYDLHPDGARVAAIANPPRTSLVFVFNFFEYLRKIAPGNK